MDNLATTARRPPSEPRKIQRLDETVVNRIAAGEVIQRPANAIKEMLENSLDAGATSIQVTVKSGGLKLIQIVDNGCGIKKEDMAIVCERFTTSKLRKFEDLSTISTYGFRGEALASISHVAHVTITTKTEDSKCAFKAVYKDGKLAPSRPGMNSDPKPCAGMRGTMIVVEDLFYNVTTRRKALKSPSEEYARIADAITKYAVHNSGVALSLRKQEETTVDVRTLQNSSIKDNIGSLYGSSVARELLEFSCEESKLGFKVKGFVTNANYSVKKIQFLLFINHRLVDSSALRKAIEAVYAAYLPKGAHPFIYMSIDITPSNIDVNVHPTKHEVHFLHEENVIESIQKVIEERLLGCNASRTYFTQALLPGAALPVSSFLCDKGTVSGGNQEDGQQAPPTYAYQMVRTDSKEQKLDAFLIPKSLQQDNQSEMCISPENTRSMSSETGGGDFLIDSPSSLLDNQSGENPTVEVLRGQSSLVGQKRRHPNSSDGGSGSSRHGSNTSGVTQPFRRKCQRKDVKLTSVKSLQLSVRGQQHRDLSELFHNHKFVGCVDQTRALIQHQTKLYLIDVTRVSKELFYQLILFDFANFGKLTLNPPAPMYDLAMIALNSPESGWTAEDGPKETLAKYIVDFTKTKAEMLKDYFSFVIQEDGCIHSLPLLLQSYSPNLDRLPLFLVRLATEVDWDKEKECFKSLATEFSAFYSIQRDPFLLDNLLQQQSSEKEQLSLDDDGVQEGRDRILEGGGNKLKEGSQCSSDLYKQSPWQWTVEHVIFPALRTDFIPPRKMAEDGSILQIADLHDLYKVFERC